MKVKIAIIIGVLCFLIFPVSVTLAQIIIPEVSIRSTPNPLGSGARALGMGNAFIAVADDATAASWNPGGLTQLETPEVSFVWYYAQRREDYTFRSNPEADGSDLTNTTEINYFSAAYPFNLIGKNMIVSLNYQRLYDLDTKLNTDLRFIDDSIPGSVLDVTKRIDYKAEGGIKALSPAYAIQITEGLSLGFTLNFWTDILGGRNGWTEEFNRRDEGTFGGVPLLESSQSSTEFDDTRGFNYNVGILWNINDIITFGAVYKSRFKARMDRSSQFQTSTGPLSVEEDRVKLRFPMSYGAGLSFRLSDALTIAFDAFRTEWDQYYFSDELGNKTSPIDGRPRNESHIEATTQVHFGAEYLFILEKTVIPVRGGIFYDPEPSEGSPEEFYGISFGSGISIGDLIIDASYQYRWGVNAENRGIPDTDVDVNQHTFYMSATYHF